MRCSGFVFQKSDTVNLAGFAMIVTKIHQSPRFVYWICAPMRLNERQS